MGEQNTILVVDDDIQVRETFSKILSCLGYECTTTSNALEALSILQKVNFPIVISDIKMTGMDGIELLKQIKERWPDTDVISITGYSDEYGFNDVIECGASDFLTKPFLKEELEAKVNRIKNERKLRSDIIASRNKLISIFDGIKDSIYIVDHDFKIHSANKALAESAGLPIRDTIGKYCYEILHGQDAPCTGDNITCPVQRCFSTGLPYTAIHEHLQGTSTAYVEVTATPMIKEGEIAKAIVVNRDISELKKSETQLQKTKEHLDNIIESSLDCIIISDPTGYIMNTNKSFLKMLGYERGDVVGKHIMELSIMEEGTYESTTGEMVEINKDFFSQSRKKTDILLEEGKISDWQSFYLRKDRKIVPVEMNIVFLYDEDGNVTGSVGINRDITERKKIEIENATLLGKTQNALAELKKTQSYLLQSEKMASVGQLAAGVAHEINNPTGFVHSNLGSLNKYSSKVLELFKKYEEGLSVLKNNGSKEVASFHAEMDELKKKLKIDFIMKDFQKVIADSLEGTGRIKKIVADLKNFSRVDQEEFKPADINEGIESTLNVVWNELKYKCTVEKDFGDIPQLLCNLGQLNQVFANLMINAAHAIEKKGAITITTCYLNGKSESGNTEQDYIEVKISDTGKGIPEDKLSRIFEPFFTTKDVGKGTGLGLSIAYDIIQKHQGEITVQSTAGKGTTFTLRLPVTEAEIKVESA